MSTDPCRHRALLNDQFELNRGASTPSYLSRRWYSTLKTILERRQEGVWSEGYQGHCAGPPGRCQNKSRRCQLPAIPAHEDCHEASVQCKISMSSSTVYDSCFSGSGDTQMIYPEFFARRSKNFKLTHLGKYFQGKSASTAQARKSTATRHHNTFCISNCKIFLVHGESCHQKWPHFSSVDLAIGQGCLLPSMTSKIFRRRGATASGVEL